MNPWKNKTQSLTAKSYPCGTPNCGQHFGGFFVGPPLCLRYIITILSWANHQTRHYVVQITTYLYIPCESTILAAIFSDLVPDLGIYLSIGKLFIEKGSIYYNIGWIIEAVYNVLSSFFGYKILGLVGYSLSWDINFIKLFNFVIVKNKLKYNRIWWTNDFAVGNL